VLANWDRIKTEEKGRDSVLDGIPASLPALARADAVLGRLDRAGLKPAAGQEPEPASQTAAQTGRSWDEAQVGGTLLDVVRHARETGIDPEAALRAAVRRLEAAGRQAERADQGVR
jgi:XTP/dITP diphosphohydrolase